MYICHPHRHRGGGRKAQKMLVPSCFTSAAATAMSVSTLVLATCILLAIIASIPRGKRFYLCSLIVSTYMFVFVCAHQIFCAATHFDHQRSAEAGACYFNQRVMVITLVVSACMRWAFAFRLAPVFAGDLTVAVSMLLAKGERDAVLVTTGVALLSHAIMTLIAHFEVSRMAGPGGEGEEGDDDDDDTKPDEEGENPAEDTHEVEMV